MPLYVIILPFQSLIDLQPYPHIRKKNPVNDMGSGEEGSILEKRFNILFSRVKMLHLGCAQKYKKVVDSVFSGQDLDLLNFMECWVI